MAPPRTARLLLLSLALAPLPASSQETEWNAPAALALVARAREARQESSADPDLRAYRARATGHVFFLVDRPDSDRRTLVKADQIALEVYWRAPSDTRQRIVGQRDEKVLPTNIRYHLDHLTVVQDDFGDLIRLGDGDEVSAVLHPAAPGSERIYDFRVGDSLALSLGDGSEVRVQEIQVRPRELDGPGFVGSVFVDRANAAIVRMTFTFTPASYVDAYLDYIRISLDNSLWEGKWWLPHRQEIEIRRELPQLDFLAGSVIRGRFDIGGYDLNPDLPPALFVGTAVTAVSEEQRRAYPFTEPLVPAEDADALAPTPSLQEVRAQALRLTAGRYLSGLSPFRLYLPSASHVFRWNRAEGSFAGAGAVWRPGGDLTVRAAGGWSFGRSEPALDLALEDAEGRVGVAGSWNRLRDLGPLPGATGAVNTLSALLDDADWLDPWFSSGVELFVGSRPGPRSTRLSAAWERHEAAAIVLDSADAAGFRPAPAIDGGRMIAVGLRHEPALPVPVAVALSARAARFDPDGEADADGYGVLRGTLAWERDGAGDGTGLLAQLDGGVAVGDAPRQELFFLGGRGTLPGLPYRTQEGDSFWLLRTEASRAVARPWVVLRAFGSAGAATWLRERPDPLEEGLPASDLAGSSVRASLGAGLGLLWDVLHVDVARGFGGDGGRWETILSVDRRFRGWL